MPFSENQSLSLSFCWCPVNFSRKSYREETDSSRKVHASLTLRSPSFHFYLLTYLFLHRKLEERVKQDIHDPFSLLRPLTNKENVGWTNHGHEGDEKRRRMWRKDKVTGLCFYAHLSFCLNLFSSSPHFDPEQLAGQENLISLYDQPLRWSRCNQVKREKQRTRISCPWFPKSIFFCTSSFIINIYCIIYWSAVIEVCWEFTKHR